MTPEEHLTSGDLSGTLSALQDKVRSDPADPKLRIFLFQLLCVLGDWKRAITQLKLSGEMDPSALMMAQTYREGIICEVYREKVFKGEKEPMIFGEPETWLALLIEAQKLLAQGKTMQAAELRAQAFEAAPMTSGTVNGTPFEWIADADMRLGPVLEVIVNGRYFWLPFNQISKLDIEAPADLRDAVWTAAALTLRNGGEVVALIPTRYAETPAKGADAEKLARATDWQDVGDDTYLGVGQRLFATDQDDVALLDVRELILVHETEEATSDG
ncbi:MAG: type VI secretion system accessory protein TagJ [Sulfitobacter sp.]